jgi:hypothetical protein
MHSDPVRRYDTVTPASGPNRCGDSRVNGSHRRSVICLSVQTPAPEPRSCLLSRGVRGAQEVRANRP